MNKCFIALLRAPFCLATILFSFSLSTYAAIDGHSHHMPQQASPTMHDHSQHAPFPTGIMGGHLHAKGDWMLAYRYMNMSMEGNRDSRNDISPQVIATTIPNRFFGMPGQPPTLRVVPTSMNMDMQMFSAMYGLTNNITLMTMASYIKNDMAHITFAGGAGTTQLGTFTTRSEGWGDTKVSALVRLSDSEQQHWHYQVGLSLPTGSVTKTGRILTPTGATPTVRLPYPMQLGSGTYDLIAGLTFTGSADKISYGVQYKGAFRLGGENSEGYKLGNQHDVTAWSAYRTRPWLSTSLRLAYTYIGNISGQDPVIVAPVQTADSDKMGSRKLMLSVGLNLIGQAGTLKGNELSLEVGKPIYQDLNGPQLKTDLIATLSYQYRF